VGAGTLIAATVACDQGTWLPSVTGFGGSVAGLLLWSAGGEDVAAASPERASMGLSVSLTPRMDGLGLSFDAAL
jgi:hypothetical protein